MHNDVLPGKITICGLKSVLTGVDGWPSIRGSCMFIEIRIVHGTLTRKYNVYIPFLPLNSSQKKLLPKSKIGRSCPGTKTLEIETEKSKFPEVLCDCNLSTAWITMLPTEVATNCCTLSPKTKDLTRLGIPANSKCV